MGLIFAHLCLASLVVGLLALMSRAGTTEVQTEINEPGALAWPSDMSFPRREWSPNFPPAKSTQVKNKTKEK